MSYDHFSYINNLSQKHVAIQHSDTRPRFFRATEQTDLTELHANLSVAQDTIVVAISPSNVGFIHPNDDSLFREPIYSVVIAHQVDATDADTIFEAQQLSESIAHDFISRIMCDARSYKHGCHFINPKSFHIDGIGPLGDMFYGIILEYRGTMPLNFKVDKSKWL